MLAAACTRISEMLYSASRLRPHLSAMKTLPVDASIVRPIGEKNKAAMPVPSTKPAVLPARVVTAPAGKVTVRSLWPFISETYTMPVLGLTAMPLGLFKLAEAPIPSLDDAPPFPASRLTFPVATVIQRTRLSSATKTMSPLSLSASAAGVLKRAAAPSPLRNVPKVDPPARLRTSVPVASSKRTSCEFATDEDPLSVQYKEPSGPTASPVGVLSDTVRGAPPSASVAELPQPPTNVVSRQPRPLEVSVGVVLGVGRELDEGVPEADADAPMESDGVGLADGHRSVLTLWLSVSTMYTTPLEPTAIPLGPVKREMDAKPTAPPALPLAEPASGAIHPAEVNRLTPLLPISVNTAPPAAVSAASPHG